jgi:hypothetical protein
MYIWTFFYRVTDTTTSKNIDISSWDTLYNIGMWFRGWKHAAAERRDVSVSSALDGPWSIVLLARASTPLLLWRGSEIHQELWWQSSQGKTVTGASHQQEAEKRAIRGSLAGARVRALLRPVGGCRQQDKRWWAFSIARGLPRGKTSALRGFHEVQMGLRVTEVSWWRWIACPSSRNAWSEEVTSGRDWRLG